MNLGRLITIALVMSVFCSTPVFAEEWTEDDKRVDPKRGYTHNQSLAVHRYFDLKDWNVTGGDISRFAYLNAIQFFPHALISRRGQVSELAVANSPAIGKIETKTAEGKLTLDAWAEGFLDGVIVVHNGTIIYERYPRMRPTDRHLWWSVSKSVAGTIVGLLESKGLIDVTKPIETYIPKLANSEWAGTPVMDILDHTSGMTGLEADDPEAYTNPASAYGLFEASLGTQPASKATMRSTYDYIATLKRQKPSGEKFEYTSVNTFVIGWLAESVTNRSYADLVSEMIWQKMGADGDAMVLVSQAGAAGAHGMISSSLRDLARYGMLFTNGWAKVASERVIPETQIKKIQTGGRNAVYKTGLIAPKLDSYLGEPVRFSTRQWDFVLSDGDFGKSGFHGQTIYISPSRNLVVASFATGMGYDTWSFARAIAKSLD